MNLPYLLKVLKTDKLSELVANINLPPLDVNLAIWDAIDNGEIAVNDDEDTVELLVEPSPSSNLELYSKILRVIEHYARQETNITRGRLNGYIKDPMTGLGYPWYEYIVAVQHLIDNGEVVEEVVIVPEETKTQKKKNGKEKTYVSRPAHTFAFLGLASNAEVNADWNKKAVAKWIENFDKTE